MTSNFASMRSCEFGPTITLNSARLNHKFHFAIVEAELAGREFQLDTFLLTRLKRDPLKAFQFLYRSRDGSSQITHVKLYNFVPGAIADVFHFHTDVQLALRGNARALSCRFVNLKRV